ncbi:MAG: HigA family addiction module antidote protein [Prevotellaceae bacterium]|jgi:addiction module HigA family antidote|nr:HigA family addiction module antidote protein [Prevotellaceae bacterium]
MGNLANSFRPYHPGELLKEELECRKISQKSFALKLGLPYTMLNEILNGKRPVSTDFALLIEASLGVSADLLARMQTSYNMQVARKDKKLIKKFNEIRKSCAIL